jgi:hypothetical protein
MLYHWGIGGGHWSTYDSSTHVHPRTTRTCVHQCTLWYTSYGTCTLSVALHASGPSSVGPASPRDWAWKWRLHVYSTTYAVTSALVYPSVHACLPPLHINVFLCNLQLFTSIPYDNPHMSTLICLHLCTIVAVHLCTFQTNQKYTLLQHH